MTDPKPTAALTESDERRFHAKVAEPDANGCMLWVANKSTSGYGQLRVARRLQPAHRIAYVLANGPIPDGLYVDHICHVRACVTPAHLRLVTRKQNNENLAGPQRGSKTGIRGVRWHSITGKWQARLCHNRKEIHLGLFDDVEDAAAAASEGRRRYFTHSDADIYDAIVPLDPDERADYITQLAHQAEHGPVAGQEHLA